MRSGLLDREVSIEYPAKSTDSTTQTQVVSWLPLVTTDSPPVAVRWMAQVQDMIPSKSEALQQGVVRATNKVRVRMRWRSGINATMRVRVYGDGERLLRIIGGPAMLGRKDAMELLCEDFSA
jgi:head-tail adaptor